jgi:hypothetical protein
MFAMFAVPSLTPPPPRRRQHQLLRVGARHAFARVFAQCVRNLVAITVASSASDRSSVSMRPEYTMMRPPGMQ